MSDQRDDAEQPIDDEEEYDLMVQLERLESLREEMEELGVSTLAELDAKIVALHRELDEREGR